ncbi:MAG: adenine deaminase [Flavitalea sp.]
MGNSFELKGWIVDILNKRTYSGIVRVNDGKIVELLESNDPDIPKQYILPGFIDSHVHIESSMLTPSEFARMAVVHGTVATISDPHEIANVCGMKGVLYMIEDGKKVPFKFYFGAPSCVPATTFETAGASLTSEEVKQLLDMEEVHYLSEMMNFPGVLNKDEEVIKKIEAAHKLAKPVDGHAPGLMGDDARNYIAAGISTDHECFTEEEALEKLQAGMKILVREGSAAKNFEALANLLHDHSDKMMFCSDDKHPDSLESSHINELCSRAVKKEIDVYKVLQAACINPVEHYRMKNGMMNEGDDADLIVVEDLENFKVLQTYINGIKVAEQGKSLIERNTSSEIPLNNFNCNPINTKHIELDFQDETQIAVIEAYDGQLITGKLMFDPLVKEGKIISDIENDILKIVVINRYQPAKPAIAFIKNFKLREGAIASSVAHDSHNIVAVGCDDESICRAVNLVVASRGGISCVNGKEELILELPVAGLMSMQDGSVVAADYTKIDAMAKSCGSELSAPFMTLSFMALLVIPHLKLSDKGLFDGDSFRLV